MNLEGTLAEVSVKEKTKIAFILRFRMTLCPLELIEKDIALGSHLEDTKWECAPIWS